MASTGLATSSPPAAGPAQAPPPLPPYSYSTFGSFVHYVDRHPYTVVVVILLVTALFATLMLRRSIPFRIKSIIGYSYVSAVGLTALLYLPYRREWKAQAAYAAQIKAQTFPMVFLAYMEDLTRANKTIQSMLAPDQWQTLDIGNRNCKELKFSVDEVPVSKMKGSFEHPILSHIRLDFYVIKFRKKENPQAPIQVITFSQQGLLSPPITGAAYHCLGDRNGLFQNPENDIFADTDNLASLQQLLQNTHPIYELANP